jgi:hypothetical protein
MARTRPNEDLSVLLDTLIRTAVEADVPQEIAEESKQATLRGLGLDPRAKVTAQTRRRIEAYFTAVLRRKVIARRTSPRATARIVVASVVADLESTGRDATAIWSELDRGWRDRIPCDVLEEYRLRLCG